MHVVKSHFTPVVFTDLSTPSISGHSSSHTPRGFVHTFLFGPRAQILSVENFYKVPGRLVRLPRASSAALAAVACGVRTWDTIRSDARSFDWSYIVHVVGQAAIRALGRSGGRLAVGCSIIRSFVRGSGRWPRPWHGRFERCARAVLSRTRSASDTRSRPVRTERGRVRA